MKWPNYFLLHSITMGSQFNDIFKSPVPTAVNFFPEISSKFRQNLTVFCAKFASPNQQKHFQVRPRKFQQKQTSCNVSIENPLNEVTQWSSMEVTDQEYFRMNEDEKTVLADQHQSPVATTKLTTNPSLETFEEKNRWLPVRKMRFFTKSFDGFFYRKWP